MGVAISTSLHSMYDNKADLYVNFFLNWRFIGKKFDPISFHQYRTLNILYRLYSSRKGYIKNF